MKAVGCREGPMSAFRGIRQRGKGSKIYGGGQKVMARKKELGTGIITETDRYLYGEGTHYKIYEKLGAHPKTSSSRFTCQRKIQLRTT